MLIKVSNLSQLFIAKYLKTILDISRSGRLWASIPDSVVLYMEDLFPDPGDNLISLLLVLHRKFTSLVLLRESREPRDERRITG